MIGHLVHTKSVVRMFKKVSDGAHGNTQGIHGSLTPCSLHKVLSAINVCGRNVLDLGAGTGVVLAAALTSGASKVHGIELPKNQANQHIFHAAMRQISKTLIDFPNLSRRALLEFNDIEEVFLASYTNCSSKHDSFSEIDRFFRCQVEPRQYTHFGTECTFRPKFTFLTYVPAANPWIALSFSAIKTGGVLRISWSISRNSGILLGRFIVQSRHRCKGPANEKPPGFSFVNKTCESTTLSDFYA